MKKKIFIGLLAALMVLSGCGANVDNSDGSDTAAYHITDLGICVGADTSLPINARNPWDLLVEDGKLYVGTGDYDANTGPTTIWAYDEITQQWVSSGTLRQEAIARFVRLNGQAVALGVDPVGDSGSADSYVLKDGIWQKSVGIEGALHVFDAEEYDGAVYFGLGSGDDETVVVKQDSKTGTFTTVPLYKGGADMMAALKQNPNIISRRVYDLIAVENRLYCVFSCGYASGKGTMEFFELVGDKFVFRQAFANTDLEINKTVKNQVLFNSDAVCGGSCYFSLGNLYRTEDFVRFEKIDFPDDACVTDLWTEIVNGQETLYVLTAVARGEGYKNAIYELAGNHLVEVFAFDHSTSALSFAKAGDVFYVGLGGAELDKADTGRILKISK